MTKLLTKSSFKKGHLVTPEMRIKISESSKGRPSGMKGRHLSDETKEKIRQVNLGNKLSDSTRLKMSQSKIGQNTWSKGKHFSEEHRKKLSMSHKGEKSYNWRGGITSENESIRKGIEYRLWREAVFARDNWTCQECKVKGGKLHPHHIKGFSEYPELRFAIDNGQTLCEECHKLTDNYGSKAYNKELDAKKED